MTLKNTENKKYTVKYKYALLDLLEDESIQESAITQ